ncbi:porin [Marinobacter sp. TBZ242]|uniref:Porin n=1 Tax=Marinobacter azerbaijanicus TaxID=3050455 RepID=A0ABT7IGB2_9GAMM|nr:porin [Marinobacter sp. TBZ242]MDL0433191.1 porin [Marinobacter sp. TBZ242]
MMNKNKPNQFLDRNNLLAITSAVVFGMGSQAVVAQSMSDRVDMLEKELEAIKAKQEKSNVVTQYKGNRLGFTSEDGDFSFNLNGRLFVDTAWADTDDGPELGQESFIRAARLAASGTLYRDWQYKFQYDFTSSGAGGIKDAYIQYHGFKPGGNDFVLSIGNQFQPFGLEGLQSGKYSTMMELSGPAQALGAGARRLGIRGDLVGDSWGWALGVAQRVPGSTSPQDDDDELDFSTKLWFDPVLEKGKLVHFGASLRQHKTSSASNGFRVRARPQTRVDGFRAVDTGGVGDTDGFVAANVEAAFIRGPLNINAEYYWAEYDELEGDAGVNAGSEPSFTGATIEGLYYLTGESRPYSPKMGGVFGPARPNNPLSRGGSGAWAIAARLNTLDLTDSGIEGGEMDVAAIGLNWFPERRIRFVLEAGVASVDGGPNDDSDPTFVQARTQLEW